MKKKKLTKQGTEFEFTINMKGHEPLTVQDFDLRQVCWDYILELERYNPTDVLDLAEHDCLDSLMQSYFTWKMIYCENGLDITDDMADIEDFITKYLKRFFYAIHIEKLQSEIENEMPKFHLN